MHPILFTIGNFPIGTHGLWLMIGFLLALKLAQYLGTKEQIRPKDIFDLSITLLLAGVLGSKMLMIIVDLFNGVKITEIFNTNYLRAGGALHGGIIAAIAMFFWQARNLRVPLLSTLDCLAPAMALGQAVGRLGCFFAGCCYGNISHMPWAVTYHDANAHLLSGTPLHVSLHPVQLYTTLASLLIVSTLLITWRYRHLKGQVLGSYLILEGVSRIILESWRGDLDRGFWFGIHWLSTGRLTSCFFVMVGLGVLVWISKNQECKG